MTVIGSSSHQECPVATSVIPESTPTRTNGKVSASRNTIPPLVYDEENTGAAFPKPALPAVSSLPVIRELPDPLLGVNSFLDWKRKRNEIATQIQHYGIGEKPAVSKDDVQAHMEADTLVVTVTVNGQSLTLRSTIHYPVDGQPPYALMIGTSMLSLPRQLFEGRPIATMNYHESQVNDYSQWRKHHERGEHAFDRLYPHLQKNGAYSEWAWGLSRLIDGLQLLGPQVTKIDTKRIGVTGCSYAGKMALYCGAFDERVALTIAQEPGGGGAAAWRASHQMDSVENLERTDYHWFLEQQRTDFSGDNVYRLPYDQHSLCALVCPRALLLLGNPDYKWLADDAMLVSAQAASKVWERFGVADRMGWSIMGGHGHCQLPEQQWPEVQAYIDRFLLGRDVSTAGIRIAKPDLDDKYATELLKPGTLAPDFKMKTPDGETIQLSEYAKGKTVVLDFWASWCPDCRKDAPEVVRLYETYHPHGVEFIGISMDTDVEAWKKAIDKYGIKYPQVSELKKFKETDIAKAYGVKWIPSIVVVGPDGLVKLSTVMSYKVDRYLQKLAQH